VFGVAGAGLVVLALAGCSSPTGSAATPTTSASAQPGGGPPSGQGGRAPGASGTVAAVDGKTLQVQGNGEQTAVVYTSKTTMTSQVATSASALAVGDCVSVRTADDSPTASTSPTDANTGTDTLAATTVTILSTGGCDGVAPGGGGGFPAGGFPGGGAPPSGRPSGVPSGVPSGLPNGGPPGGRGFGGFGALGEVTATTSGSFTLTRIMLGRPGGGTSTASPTTSPSGTPATVSYDGDTSFLTTQKVKATAITVGLCVRATGSTDDTGTLTATTLALSQPTDGSCLTGVRGG
jgi:hypothetical protein